MKRYFSIFLSLCMLLTMALTVSADEDSGFHATPDADSDQLADSEDFGGASKTDDGDDRQAETPLELTVRVNGQKYTGDALEIVSKVVQNEVGSGFHEEAIKAQAVAAYTFIAQSNAEGGAPTVYFSDDISPNVQAAVEAVMGEAILYKGKLAFTPYHATSASSTTSSASVWGGKYAYLVAVESPADKKVKGYKTKVTYSSDEVAERISSKLGIEVSGDPESWLEILSYTDGGYVDEMAVAGNTTSATGAALTGRLLRESVLGLRSACFDISYEADTDTFIFITYGYGHGVGMSQNGANAYAADGWDYIEILEHYYPGTTVV